MKQGTEKVIFEGTEEEVAKAMRRYTRRSMVWSGLAGLSAVFGIKWLAGQKADGGISGPLRAGLKTNESIFRNVFSPSNQADELSLDTAVEDRQNGAVGLQSEFDPAVWMLEVSIGDGAAMPFTLEEIQQLSRKDMVTEFRCIEGWSATVHWAGVKLSDFVDRHMPEARSKKFVALETPDGEYFVGLDIESALHPQTLLCYEMNGKPLTMGHGAPLRLVIPVKYGVKNLKRIGSIKFTDDRPKDYWADEGYDWYASL